MRFRDRPIEQKIFLLILPICLIPAIVFLVLVVVGLRVVFEGAMGSELQRGAQAIASSFDGFVEERRTQLVRRTLGLRGDLDGLLRESRASGWIEAVALVEPDDRLLIFPTREGRADLPNILARQEQFFHSWTRRFRQSGPARGMLLDLIIPVQGSVEPLRFVAFALTDEAGRQYFYLSHSYQLIREFRPRLSRAPDFLIVYSANGYLIYNSETLTEAAEQRIIDRLRDPKGPPSWFSLRAGRQTLLLAGAEPPLLKRQAHEHPGSADWTFLQRYDMEIFLGPQDALIWLSILLALGLVLLLLGFATVAARWLVAPLQRLHEQSEALAQGRLDVRATVDSHDEIGALADAFNRMATQLRGSYQSLEMRLEENRIHAEHINVINEIGRAIVQALSMDRIFEILDRELHKILDFDAIWLALHDREAGELRVGHIQPHSLITLFDRGKIPSRNSLHHRVIGMRETMHAEIGPRHSGEFFETGLFNSEGIQSLLIAPLPSRDGIIGTLTVASTQPDAYNHELADIMSSLAQAVSIAIEQADLFQQISHMAGELERKVAERTEELRVATRKLIQTEKYFATGRMAGNLSHEINNPLGIIKNYLALVRGNLRQAGGGRRKSDPNLEHLEVIDEEVNRIARLVRQLLDLHRPVEQKIQPVDINAILDEILSLVEEGLKRRNISVVREFDPQLPWPIASADLIRQVLINLIRNAQDAMEGQAEGTLSIRTSTISQWEDDGEQQVVRIRVADTGCGIEPEQLSQIFDPFFTTKSPDRGSGLGLCVSYGIIRMYRGTIDVESVPGRGTTFTISLPILERHADGPGALAPRDAP